MRASACLFAAAGLALVGCKSNVSSPAGQALTSCGSGEVLLGPSTGWSCKPASTLDFAAATSADSSPAADEAEYIAHAQRVSIADQAASIAPSPDVFLQDGTFPLPLP